jgi:hypothetical protein
MTTRLYWVTFRIEEIGNAEARRKALYDAVSECANGQWWKEPTSFVLFESDLTIGSIAARLKRAIDLKNDVVLIGMPDFKGGRVIGKVKDRDLFDLWEGVQTA